MQWWSKKIVSVVCRIFGGVLGHWRVARSGRARRSARKQTNEAWCAGRHRLVHRPQIPWEPVPASPRPEPREALLAGARMDRAEIDCNFFQ